MKDVEGCLDQCLGVLQPYVFYISKVFILTLWWEIFVSLLASQLCKMQ